MDVRLAVNGFGNVGQGLATLLDRHAVRYHREYGVRLMLTGAVDRQGAAVNDQGLDPQELLRAKHESGTVAVSRDGDRSAMVGDVLKKSGAQIFVEAASTNFEDAEPGWSSIRTALERGMDVVLASKGALALFYGDLMAAANECGRRVLFSATVGSPLPSLQIAERALVGTRILGFEGILNGTSHQVLSSMSAGASYEDGVREAQRLGIAETDPTLDVDGWDAAAKTTILANAILGASLSIHDVEREGIRGVTPQQLHQATSRSEAIKLIARASGSGSEVQASVKPEARPLNDALGRLSGDAMGIVFEVDPLGFLATTAEGAGQGGGITTAMTVLRDVFNLCRDRGWMR